VKEIFLTFATSDLLEYMERLNHSLEDSAIIPGLLMYWRTGMNLISEYVLGSETGEP